MRQYNHLYNDDNHDNQNFVYSLACIQPVSITGEIHIICEFPRKVILYPAKSIVFPYSAR